MSAGLFLIGLICLGGLVLLWYARKSGRDAERVRNAVAANKAWEARREAETYLDLSGSDPVERVRRMRDNGDLRE